MTDSSNYEAVIGLEVHTQLVTDSKMFCGCSTAYSGAPPNTHVCPVCLGLPGTLPVINERAIEYIVLTGLALNCEIADRAKFDRKNYHYPDLMKGYQISQYDLPICYGGWLDIEVDGEKRHIGITRIHMEEDTARLLHRDDGSTGLGYSLIDVNRSGTPLIECVSEPDLRSPAEAREYLLRLRQILRYIGVSEANMEEGNFRCDANVSLRPIGGETYGTKVEVKNMNSFRSVHDALAFEIDRQTQVLERGGAIAQETRGWVEERRETVSQRTKEYSEDYRYFPEPDLPPLAFTPERIESIRARLPELPEARRQRFLAEGLSDFEATTLTELRARADFYEELRAAIGEGQPRAAKLAANWVLGDVARWVNTTGRPIEEFPVPAERLAELIRMAEEGRITGTAAKSVFEQMLASQEDAETIVEREGLVAVRGDDELTAIVRGIIEANDQAVTDYRAGKTSAIKFLTGQVMRETKGRANPQTVQQILERELN